MINARHLRALRIDRGLSQRKLAASAGVDALTIKRIEGGADASDLSLRVLTKVAKTLGVQPDALLQESAVGEGADAPSGMATIGAALAAGRRCTRAGLARVTDLSALEVDGTLIRLASQLAPLGIAVASHGDEVWLAPATAAAASGERQRPLDVNQARLLRRIHRGEDVRRSLSRAERTLILPSLMRRKLVSHSDATLQLSDAARTSLSSAESRCTQPAETWSSTPQVDA